MAFDASRWAVFVTQDELTELLNHQLQSRPPERTIMTNRTAFRARADGEGFEEAQDSSNETTIADQSASKSASISSESTAIDPDLIRVIAAWSSLPDALRKAILAIVGAG